MSTPQELACELPYRKKCYEKDVYSKSTEANDVAETKHTWNSTLKNMFQDYTVTRDFKIRYSRTVVTPSSSEVAYFVTQNYLDVYGCGDGLSDTNTSYKIAISENFKEIVNSRLYCNYKTNCFLTEKKTRTVSFKSEYSGNGLPKKGTSILAALAMFGGVWHAKFVVKAKVKDVIEYVLNAPSTKFVDELIYSTESESYVQLPCLIWRPVGSTEQLQADVDIDEYGYYNPLDDRVDAGGADYYFPKYLRENCINKNYLQNRAWQRYYTDLNIKTQGFVPQQEEVTAEGIASLVGTLDFKPTSNLGSDALYLDDHLAAFNLESYGIKALIQKSIPVEIVSKMKELNDKFSVASII